MDKTYSLYFSGREKTLIKDDITDPDQAMDAIVKFIRKVNPDYMIHYIRSWGTNPILYDVGSYTEFFELHENK